MTALSMLSLSSQRHLQHITHRRVARINMASIMMFARSYQSFHNQADQCTKTTCPLTLSYWSYLPSLAANGLFLGLFSLSLFVFIGQSVLSRRFLGFTIAMVSGCILECLGYAGRVWSWYDPFNEVSRRHVTLTSFQMLTSYENGFLIQIICLTIAPAFLAAGLYLTLSRIVMTFGAANSRIKPLSYPRIFIPCDFISLMLQAAGGGIASAASHQNKNPAVGDHIMVAGLAFQVITLFVFICLAADFSIRTIRRYKTLGATDAFDQAHADLRKSKKFQGFLVALAFATLCIFTRSVYRVAELSEGWTGHLIETQKYFIGLEGATVSAAVLALNFFHPGFCFREGDVNARGAFGFGKKSKNNFTAAADEKAVSSDNEPPVLDQVREI